MLKLEPVWQPDTQQALFRILMNAMAHPGRGYSLQDCIANNTRTSLAVLATLLDGEVSLADPHCLLDDRDWPLLQAKSATNDQADYILCDALQAADFVPKIGSLVCPEQSATLIMVMKSLTAGELALQLSGPGIQTTTSCHWQGMDHSWLTLREQCNASFPLGIDMLLLADSSITAIPRTTHVELV